MPEAPTVSRREEEMVVYKEAHGGGGGDGRNINYTPNVEAWRTTVGVSTIPSAPVTHPSRSPTSSSPIPPPPSQGF